jgi:hypothetical protein
MKREREEVRREELWSMRRHLRGGHQLFCEEYTNSLTLPSFPLRKIRPVGVHAICGVRGEGEGEGEGENEIKEI